MRLHPLFSAALLPGLTIGARSSSKSSASVFDTYFAKSQALTPLPLSDNVFDEITSIPRNHSFVACLTAMEARLACQVCREFQPEWDLLAKSWMKGDKNGDSKLLFGTLDFADGRQTFQSLRLETAPVLIFFPATIGPNAKSDSTPERYDFTTGPPRIEEVREWIIRNLPADAPKPHIRRPINWIKVIALTVIALGVVTGFTVAWPYVSPIVQNRTLWAAVSVVAILLFTSGHMFNHIRQTPYVSGDGKGGVAYISGGFQNQFGLESQIVAVIYALLAFATIVLAVKVPRIKDPRSQQISIFLWSAVIYGTYSMLLSIFRFKNTGYPFFLPPF